MSAPTTAMLRELRAIQSTGEVGDLLDYGSNALAFYAREKTLTALLRRDLIVSEAGGYVLTDAGREALAKATGSTT
jgi:hypothetical protein